MLAVWVDEFSKLTFFQWAAKTLTKAGDQHPVAHPSFRTTLVGLPGYLNHQGLFLLPSLDGQFPGDTFKRDSDITLAFLEYCKHHLLSFFRCDGYHGRVLGFPFRDDFYLSAAYIETMSPGIHSEFLPVLNLGVSRRRNPTVAQIHAPGEPLIQFEGQLDTGQFGGGPGEFITRRFPVGLGIGHKHILFSRGLGPAMNRH